jgi:uncharacterized protein (TIGR02145 family)
MVNFGIEGGYISVRAENSCGETPYTNLPVTPFACGDAVTDFRDGKIYPTVQIGTQCWFAKNLNIGTRINADIPQEQQYPEIIEKYCYNNKEDSCTVYGGLYQWNEMMNYSTAESSQGICPSGWHVPSDAEWCILETYLDITVDCYAESWRGTDAGRKLKEAGTAHWNPTNDATNSSGFTVLPAGTGPNGNFSGIRTTTYLWTSTASWYAAIRMLQNEIAQIYRYPSYYKTNGFSVRCVRN